MKNPRGVFVRNSIKEGNAELVKFVGYIVHVDISSDKKTRLCFKSDTQDKESALISVDAWHNEKGPDWRKILGDAKGRWAVVLATKTVDSDFTNYTLESVDMAPTK